MNKKLCLSKKIVYFFGFILVLIAVILLFSSQSSSSSLRSSNSRASESMRIGTDKNVIDLKPTPGTATIKFSYGPKFYDTEHASSPYAQSLSVGSYGGPCFPYGYSNGSIQQINSRQKFQGCVSPFSCVNDTVIQQVGYENHFFTGFGICGVPKIFVSIKDVGLYLGFGAYPENYIRNFKLGGMLDANNNYIPDATEFVNIIKKTETNHTNIDGPLTVGVGTTSFRADTNLHRGIIGMGYYWYVQCKEGENFNRFGLGFNSTNPYSTFDCSYKKGTYTMTLKVSTNDKDPKEPEEFNGIELKIPIIVED